MAGYGDDSTGKSKITESRVRNHALLGFFLLGLCIGVVIAERMYVSRQLSNPAPKVLTQLGEVTGQVKSSSGAEQTSKAVVQEEKGSKLDLNYNGPPRNELEKYLRQIAPNKEVLVAVANKNVNWDGMLDTFTSCLLRSKVPNHLILALDEETKAWCDKKGVNAFLQKVEIYKEHQGTGDNHAVSAMKFGILKKFIELGWSVFLSDVDIVTLQNPFDFLYRDHDVEGMTDGFTESLAYGSIEGFDDPTMGWARYAQFYKHFNLNSGLFYVKANDRTLDLMTRLETRLSKEKYWDQTAWNEEIFFLSHGDYKSPQVTVRVLDIFKFMNSKVLFKDVRKRPKQSQPAMPVTVHVNYHPDKHERMKAIIKYYVDKDEHALDRFPGGSEPGSR